LTIQVMLSCEDQRIKCTRKENLYENFNETDILFIFIITSKIIFFL